jgi:hypothetical protein
MSSCNYCPANIKASIDFLGHRAVIQKAELSSSWKKSFYKKIWDRLHTEREWVDAIDDEEAEPVSPAGSGADGDEEEEATGSASAAAGDEGDEEGSESGDGQSSNNMNALIKAAAIWLTKDEKTKGGKNTRPRNKRGADSPSTPRGKNEEDDDDSPGKRRRVTAV